MAGLARAACMSTPVAGRGGAGTPAGAAAGPLASAGGGLGRRGGAGRGSRPGGGSGRAGPAAAEGSAEASWSERKVSPEQCGCECDSTERDKEEVWRALTGIVILLHPVRLLALLVRSHPKFETKKSG